MYHPTRGGVRGGRDQFSWDDVKVDKHRENYLGHSIKASIGRWQKGKDLHWYTRDKNSKGSEAEALKEEIRRVKEEEEQAMREALGLAPKRSSQPQGNRLDKHELSELVKRGSTAEDLGAGHAEAARVDGLGFSRMPRPWEDPSTLPSTQKEASPEMVKVEEPVPSTANAEEGESEYESSRKRKRREEKRQEKHDRHEKRREKHDRHEKRHEKHGKHERHEKLYSRDSDDKRSHKKEKEKEKRA
ncbi:Leukocyte immunoglobulin-like receptor subfamily A member 5 isoform 2 [Hibiscus syriacus]|uniref:Leukocyte immunoglobulin-like receptor subfamily A member 5 isoform 2 n=1 Tax=Hibiscus syriacus TaxID=106335 RepID=A0A6A2YZJ9_HIBSY|nr:multiple myeloma tumor-associated protein 2 homolog isoform X1 [Hibiscus syriacus]KAE8684342.1 Leukocyte immunoglobulin-like receptor subfamily A member 5 isoform 2 [Hibiscus syriacus]